MAMTEKPASASLQASVPPPAPVPTMTKSTSLLAVFAHRHPAARREDVGRAAVARARGVCWGSSFTMSRQPSGGFALFDRLPRIAAVGVEPDIAARRGRAAEAHRAPQRRLRPVRRDEIGEQPPVPEQSAAAGRSHSRRLHIAALDGAQDCVRLRCRRARRSSRRSGPAPRPRSRRARAASIRAVRGSAWWRKPSPASSCDLAARSSPASWSAAGLSGSGQMRATTSAQGRKLAFGQHARRVRRAHAAGRSPRGSASFQLGCRAWRARRIGESGQPRREPAASACSAPSPAIASPVKDGRSGQRRPGEHVLPPVPPAAHVARDAVGMKRRCRPGRARRSRPATRS